MKPFVLVIDGIIGAGKSTLVNRCIIPILGERFNIVFIPEPIEEWKSSGRLEQFYSDPARRAYQFQTRVFHDRIKMVREYVSNAKKRGQVDLYILERSIFTDTLFMKTLLEQGTIDRSEYDDYTQLWNMWVELMPIEIDLFLYLKPSLKTVMSRLALRNRKGEGGVSTEYQSILEKHHNEFFESRSDSITVSTECNFRDCPDAKQSVANTVLKEIRHRMYFQDKKCDADFYSDDPYVPTNSVRDGAIPQPGGSTSRDEEWAIGLEIIFSLVEEFEIGPETVCLGFELFNSVCETLDADTRWISYIMASFSIAVKFIETQAFRPSYFANWGMFSENEFFDAEVRILSAIGFNIPREYKA